MFSYTAENLKLPRALRIDVANVPLNVVSLFNKQGLDSSLCLMVDLRYLHGSVSADFCNSSGLRGTLCRRCISLTEAFQDKQKCRSRIDKEFSHEGTLPKPQPASIAN